jgi:hypothetical protein
LGTDQHDHDRFRHDQFDRNHFDQRYVHFDIGHEHDDSDD